MKIKVNYTVEVSDDGMLSLCDAYDDSKYCHRENIRLVLIKHGIENLDFDGGVKLIRLNER